MPLGFLYPKRTSPPFLRPQFHQGVSRPEFGLHPLGKWCRFIFLALKWENEATPFFFFLQ
jgi:hypothetical protein